jgi:hypothetical protein
MSVNRPRLLMRALRSLKSHTIALHESRIFRFQDCAQSRFVQVPLDSSLQDECVREREFSPKRLARPKSFHSPDFMIHSSGVEPPKSLYQSFLAKAKLGSRTKLNFILG